jgi:4-amino-4-deoxy-L-arabinose transferase-like glycosyltransferase
LGVVLGGVTVLIGFFAAREVLPPLLASAVPVAMAGIPMFTAVSASVSADPLANLLAATLVLALLRRVRAAEGPNAPSSRARPEQTSSDIPRGRSRLASAPTWRSDAALGALLGLGLLTKLALAIFVPLAIVVVLLRPPRLRAIAVLLGTMLLVLTPWLVHQVTTYGWTDPLAITRHAQVVADQPRPSALSAAYLQDFLTITFHSFWAQFGWMAIPASNTLYWIWASVLIAAVVGLLRDPKRLTQPAWLLLLATAAAAAAALVAYNLSFTQFQGRYLFPALVPIATLVVLGWASLAPRRFGEAAGLGAAWLLVALNAYTFVRVLSPGFAPA